MPRNTHPVERYWAGAQLKQWRNTQGSAERCQGHLNVQCRAKWLWLSGYLRSWSDTFPQFNCLYRIGQDKSVENTWELGLQGKGRRLLLAHYHCPTWLRNIMGCGWGLVLIPCSGPIGKPTLKSMFLQGSHRRTGHSATRAPKVILDCRMENPRPRIAMKQIWGDSWREGFIPDEFNFKGNGISKTETVGYQGAKLWLTLQPASCAYRWCLYTCLVNCGNYTKRDLKWKWPDWGSFDSPKLILLHN